MRSSSARSGPSNGVSGSERFPLAAKGAPGKARTVRCAAYDASLERVSKERGAGVLREGRGAHPGHFPTPASHRRCWHEVDKLIADAASSLRGWYGTVVPEPKNRSRLRSAHSKQEIQSEDRGPPVLLLASIPRGQAAQSPCCPDPKGWYNHLNVQEAGRP